MEILSILGLFNNKEIAYLFIMVKIPKIIAMGEILFAIINLVIGAFALCYFCTDKDKEP